MSSASRSRHLPRFDHTPFEGRAGSPGGIPHPGSHRTGHEPLDSSGSCHATTDEVLAGSLGVSLWILPLNVVAHLNTPA